MIPIFITIKGTSKRFPNKNRMLLPYAYDYLSGLNKINETVVISDSEDLLYFAQELGFINIFKENRETQKSELHSIYNYMQETNNIYSWFIHYPITQPLKEKDLINKCIYNISNEIDLITSYVSFANRDVFKINIETGEFKIPNVERRGCLSQEEYMVDGAIYCLPYRFLREVIKAPNSNYHFWNNSRKKLIENKFPLIDVDRQSDMTKLYNIKLYNS